MELIKTMNGGITRMRKAELYALENGRVEVFCMVGDQMSHAFKVRDYATLAGAERYAAKFLAA